MKTIIISIILVIFTLTLNCQIINIYEIKGPKDEILINENGIADINSNLELRINKKDLTIKVGSRLDSNSELILALEKYDSILIFQKQILSSFNQNISQLTLNERIQKLGEFSNLMSDLYDIVKSDKQIRSKFNQYIQEFNKFPEIEKNKYHNYYIEYGFEQLTTELKRNIEKIQASIEKERIKIQLTAYLNTKDEKNKKVHIENFDEYKNGEFYEVNRMVTSFSKEDIEAFNRTNELAKDLNSLIDKSFKDIRGLILNNTNSFTCLNELQANLNKLINKKDKIFAANVEIAEKFLLEMQKELIPLLNAISKIEDYNGKNENVLELYNSIHEEFINTSKLFTLNINTLVSKLPDDFKKSNQEIIDFINQINSCKTVLSEDLIKVQKVISITSNALMPFKNAAQQGLEIGNEVYKFGINELPEIGYIDLKNTGKRENRDNLIVRLTICSGEVDKQNSNIVVEKQTIILQQIKVYSVSNVSVILANPYNKSDMVKLENECQFAPSGSFLFKVGSRKCKTWNFLEPALGFNVSTPDFDLDGVPEVGLGCVFTILQDVVSIGLSYNTKTDNPYWFFGLSLPFTTFGLPINTIKKEELK